MSGEPLDVHVILRPDEKCCFTTFLPDSVPCAPCAMRTHRTASQQSLVRRACRRTSGICRRGLPCTPFLCLRPDEKCCSTTFLPDSVPCAPCAMRTHRTASQQSLVRRACRRTSGICRRGLPCTPFLCLRPDEKCCSTTFLPDSVPCAPCAMCTHRTTSQNIFLCYVRCAYLFVQQVGAAFSCDLQRLFRAPGVHLLVVARDQYVGDG